MAKRKKISRTNREKRKGILDKVIENNLKKEKADFNPVMTVAFIVQDLPPRPLEVVKERFGLEGGSRKTLQEIGQKFGVTRERIRQIENQAKEMLRKKIQEEEAAKETQFIRRAFEEVGGISSLDFILEKLLGPEKTNTVKATSTSFLLEVGDDFIKFPADQEVRSGYTLHKEYINQAKEIIFFITKLLKKEKKPLLEEELISRVKKEFSARSYLCQLSDDALRAILDLSEGIALSNFGEWGLIEWQEILPRNIRGKAYLVLKKHGKPAHFTEIADLINQAKFDSRKANPETVHNELIKDPRFVLIGRGVYALSDWGFKKGTVSAVIRQLLKESARPLTREELVKKVLEQRRVQVNTIILALQDKRIKRDAKDRFWI